MFSSEPVSRLSTQMTRCPCASRKSQRWDPRKPAPPVTTEVGTRGSYVAPARRMFGMCCDSGARRVPVEERRLTRAGSGAIVACLMAVAAPVPSTGPSDARGDDSRTQFYALVRTVRADVQDFERSLDHVAEACATAKLAGDDAALRKALRAERPLTERIEQRVGASLIEIRDGVFAVDHALWSDVADEIRHLDNLWNRVISDWPPTANEAREDVELRVARVQGLVRQMLFHAAAPDRRRPDQRAPEDACGSARRSGSRTRSATSSRTRTIAGSSSPTSASTRRRSAA